MAGTVEKNFEGTVAIGSANNTTDSRQIIHRYFSRTVAGAAGTDQDNAVFQAQSPMTLKAAWIVPSIATAAAAVDYLTLTLGKGDQAAGAITAFDSFDTASGGDNVSLAARTAQAFTIEPTDTLDTGDTLYLQVANAGAGAALGGVLIVEYELQG